MKFVGIAIACFSATFFFAAALCRADTHSSHRQAVEELFIVTHMAGTINAVAEQLIEEQIRQNPGIAPYRETIKEFMQRHLNWENLKDDVAELYMQEFTEEETREIAAFYRTPTGQKTLALLPVLLSRSYMIGQRRVEANFGELQRMILKKSRELKRSR